MDPSVITLIGTLAGGMLAGGVALWSSNLTRKRDAEADIRRFELDRRKTLADRRDALYVRWLQACVDVETAIQQGKVQDVTQRVSDFLKLGEEVKAHGSDELSRQIDASVALWLSWLAATTDNDRTRLTSEIVDQRLKTAAVVRPEVQGFSTSSLTA